MTDFDLERRLNALISMTETLQADTALEAIAKRL